MLMLCWPGCLAVSKVARLPNVTKSGAVVDCSFGEQEVVKAFMLDKDPEAVRAAMKRRD